MGEARRKLSLRAVVGAAAAVAVLAVASVPYSPTLVYEGRNLIVDFANEIPEIPVHFSAYDTTDGGFVAGYFDGHRDAALGGDSLGRMGAVAWPMAAASDGVPRPLPQRAHGPRGRRGVCGARVGGCRRPSGLRAGVCRCGSRALPPHGIGARLGTARRAHGLPARRALPLRLLGGDALAHVRLGGVPGKRRSRDARAPRIGFHRFARKGRALSAGPPQTRIPRPH
jgi:hypothetical protein